MSIAIISFGFFKIFIKGLDGYFYQASELIVSQLSFFFFIGLRVFFFFIESPVFLIASIYFSNSGEKLEGCLRLNFNDFIKHFV